MADLEPTTEDNGQEQQSSVEETSNEETHEENHEEELPPEVLREKLTAANKQAAAERVKRQEALKEAEELRARLAEAKTKDEMDALMAEHEERLRKSNLEAERYRAALAAGLSEDMVDRVRGDSYEEMLKDAEFLSSLTGSGRPPQDPRVPAGGRTPREEPGDEPGSGYRAALKKHSF